VSRGSALACRPGGAHAEPCRELVECDYGAYEGLTDAQTQRREPGWDLFRDGAPAGESPGQIAARVEALLAALRDASGPWLLVGHGKMLRALAALWLECRVSVARVLPMHPAAIAVFDREGGVPSPRLWDHTPSALGIRPASLPAAETTSAVGGGARTQATEAAAAEPAAGLEERRRSPSARGGA
jgi:broad specificity phosphatase PhoE